MKNIKSMTIMCLVVTALAAGCALFRPTPDGNCPPVTVNATRLIAYTGALSALKAGAPAAILTTVATNIDLVVATGSFDIKAVENAVAQAGGQAWVQYLAGVELVFQLALQTSVDQQLNAQVCCVPVLQSISSGIKQAVELSQQPAKARLAPLNAE